MFQAAVGAGSEARLLPAGATPRLSALILCPAEDLTPSTRKGSAYAKRAAAASSPAR
jgi:hypothetical protein